MHSPTRVLSALFLVAASALLLIGCGGGQRGISPLAQAEIDGAPGSGTYKSRQSVKGCKAGKAADCNDACTNTWTKRKERQDVCEAGCKANFATSCFSQGKALQNEGNPVGALVYLQLGCKKGLQESCNQAAWVKADPRRVTTPPGPPPSSARGGGSKVLPGQVFGTQTASWADVIATAEGCRTTFQSGAGSNECILLVAVYDYVEGRTGGAAQLMSMLCPKAADNNQRKVIAAEVLVDAARLYWIKQGQPQPAGPLTNDKLTTALTAVPPAPLLTACGVQM
jgi:hypothetical protein